jgi:hypothetical protein
LVNKYEQIIETTSFKKYTDSQLKGFLNATQKNGGYKKLQLEFLKYSETNNIKLSNDIINQIYYRNKEIS